MEPELVTTRGPSSTPTCTWSWALSTRTAGRGALRSTSPRQATGPSTGSPPLTPDILGTWPNAPTSASSSSTPRLRRPRPRGVRGRGGPRAVGQRPGPCPGGLPAAWRCGCHPVHPGRGGRAGAVPALRGDGDGPVGPVPATTQTAMPTPRARHRPQNARARDLIEPVVTRSQRVTIPPGSWLPSAASVDHPDGKSPGRSAHKLWGQ